MKELLQAIRESCSPSTWSRGVQLARAGAVMGEADEGDEVVLRVALKGGMNSVEVVLFPEELDWTCDCNFTEDACPHVAAGAIALKQAREGGQNLPGEDQDDTPGHIAYRLDGRTGPLALHRVVCKEGQDHVLDGSLATVAAGTTKAPKFVAKPEDLAFEKKLGMFAGGVIPRPRMGDVLDALRDVRELTLDGAPAEVGPSTSGLAVRVTAQDGGFLVRLEQDTEINEVYDNGAVRRGAIIHPVGGHGLAEGEFRELRKGRIFGPGDVGTLVGDVLPRLRRHVSVVIDAPELPGAKTAKPYVHLVTDRAGDQLSVLPTIVYGDPPVARVDRDKLTILREGDVPLRNVRLEQRLLSQLEQLGLEPGARATLTAADAIALSERSRELQGVRLAGDAARDLYVAGHLRPRLEVDAKGNYSVWFEPAADGKGGAKGRVDAAAVIDAWERGDEFAPMLGGGFGQIPREWLAQHGDRVAGLLAAREAMREGHDQPATWAVADLAALCEALDQAPPPGFDRLRTLIDDFEGIPEPTLPGDLTATLRDYQRRGVAWLAFLRHAELGGLLADDMGLGKTLQALCVIERPTLVVAPTSVLHNWAAEIEKFRPGLAACIYHGSDRSVDPEADVTLTTYAILRLDIDTLADRHWNTVVLDEAQAIKNPQSKVARAAYRLNAECRIALTGTPVENRLEDLWSQFHFLNRGLLFGRSEFVDRFAKPIAAGDEQAALALRARVKPFVLRRLKAEVASELPPRTDIVLQCELDTEERRAYDAVRAATQETVVEQLGGGANVMAMLEALLRLRQAACHPALLPGQGQQSTRRSSKVDLLLETLDEVVSEGHKALVFSQWTSMLDLIEPQLEASGLGFTRLDGSTRDRGAVVAKFQDPDGPPVMLISLKAGGTGLNLTAADHVFLVDPWWNPAVEDQAADRAHRIGQDNPVLVHRLVARDTVEERILALQERKRRLAETAIGDAKGASTITRDELLELLS